MPANFCLIARMLRTLESAVNLLACVLVCFLGYKFECRRLSMFYSAQLVLDHCVGAFDCRRLQWKILAANWHQL